MDSHEKDKQYLKGWMEKYCNGFRQSRTKNDILPHLLGAWNERYFREIMSELKQEGHVSSTSSLGYWFNPLCTTDREEIMAEMDSAEEMRSRALSMIESAAKRIKQCQERIASMTFQPTFNFDGGMA